MTASDDLPPIDDFSRHEVLHVASIAADFFERYLIEHRAVQADPRLRAEAERIGQELWDFYQAVGEGKSEEA